MVPVHEFLARPIGGAPLGPARTNKPNDVNATSSALAWAGFPITPGGGSSTDHGLTDAIKRFQKSQNLKVDGWLRPYGETERMLNRTLRPMVENLKLAASAQTAATSPIQPFQVQGQQQGGIRVPIPKGVYDIATFFGLPVLVAMDWLHSMSGPQQEKVKKRVAGHGSGGDDGNLEKECEIRYAIDTETCNGITRKRGKTAGWRCHKTAADRYDACLRGIPVEYSPALDTWNQ